MLWNRRACSDNVVKGFHLRRGSVYCLVVLITCLLTACAKRDEAAATAPAPSKYESGRPAAETATPAPAPPQPPVGNRSTTGRSQEQIAREEMEMAREKITRGSEERAKSSAPSASAHESARTTTAPPPQVDHAPAAGDGAAPAKKAKKMHAHRRAEPDSESASSTEDQDGTLPAFPWPPPKPSARLDIPLMALTKAANAKRHEMTGSPEPRVLGDINAALITVLEAAGYRERSYFAVPSGFALVTRLEAINADGSAKPSADTQPVGKPFALSGILDKLLHVQKGWYRVVAFVVTSSSTGSSMQPPSESEANDWLVSGGNALPEPVSRVQIAGHICTAYIYEFEKSDVNPDAHLMYPSSPDSASHLIKMGFAGVLQ